MARKIRHNLLVQTDRHSFELTLKTGLTVINHAQDIDVSIVFDLIRDWCRYYHEHDFVFVDGEKCNTEQSFMGKLDVDDKVIVIHRANMAKLRRLGRHIETDLSNQYIVFGNHRSDMRARHEHVAALLTKDGSKYGLDYRG